ncbi:GNAT family N-acetyltransferase [Belliella pelovolcani]|uniref:GNAT family N-acetyltransferase n=1 Tax=Belliella pelovolcani TaxID=529505 RepID=UPI00391C4068
MLKGYKIGIVKGNDRNIGNLIGWYAMDREVIKEMDGYPILTDSDTTWFVAHKNLEVIAFGAVKKMKNHAVMTYSFVFKSFRKKGLHKELINRRLDWIKEQKINLVKADCTKSSLPNMKAVGFKVIKAFQNWTKVELNL